MPRVAEVVMGCGHRALFRSPPRVGEWLWCTRCDTGVQVIDPDADARTMDHGPWIVRLPRGRRRQTVDRRTRATDWAAGPPARVLLACTHVRWYRPPSPARGDHVTCGCCGRPTVVLRPVRRTDRHGGPWTARALDVPG